jgi:DNA polymerase III delta prime subunit
MLNWFRNFELEKISFLIGFIAATILWWILSKAKKWFPEIRDSIAKLKNKIQRNQSSGLLIAVKKDAFKRAQSNHLASKLFSLDEIVVEPLLLIPELVLAEKEHGLFSSEISQLIPSIAELPQITRNFPLPKISIMEALQGEGNLIISGLPGSGKSTSLAFLAARLAENNPKCGVHCGKTPFCFHILDTNILEFPDQPLTDLIYRALSQFIPNHHLPKLAKFIQFELESNQAVILIDGIDELYKNEADTVFGFLERTSKQYPKIKFVISASPYYSGNLENRNFLAYQLAPFSNKNVQELNRKWIGHWYKYISPNDANSPTIMKERLISNWVNLPLPGYSPLEYTLLVWGALSGDLKGYDTFSLYQSHFMRIFQNNYAPDMLTSFAIQFVTNKSASISGKSVDSNLLSTLMEWGIVRRSNESLSMNHLDLLGYLAGMASIESSSGKSLIGTSWDPIEFSYQAFRSSIEKNSSLIDENFFSSETPDFYNVLLLIPWLKHTTAKSTWRVTLFKVILRSIQNPNTPLGLKFRYISAFIYANDPSLGILQKQLLSQNNEDFKKLALISIGSLTNNEAYDHEIIAEMPKYSSEVLKYAVLALATHEEEFNLDTLARLLLSANEDIRKLIAECLAHLSEQSKEILQDAITMDDILVRRSAVFGLVNINEPWSYDIIKKLTVEDNQWIIRDLASQAIDYYNSTEKWILRDKKPLHETEWLIQLAANENIGLSPDIIPLPLFEQILSSGSELDQTNLLYLIPNYYAPNLMPKIMALTNSKNQKVSNAAIHAVWQVFKMGNQIDEKNVEAF